MAFDPSELHGLRAAGDLPFRIRKIGHVVIRASDLRKSAEFYTQLLGFEISDIYPESMVPGGMVFMRCNTDHHGVALVGGASKLERSSLNHFAFEVGSPDEVFRARAWLRSHNVPIYSSPIGAAFAYWSGGSDAALTV